MIRFDYFIDRDLDRHQGTRLSNLNWSIMAGTTNICGEAPVSGIIPGVTLQGYI